MGRTHVEKEPAACLGHKKIISSLLAGRYLNIQEWVYLHIVLKMRFRVSTAIIGCDALPPGPERFRLWERLLLLPSMAGSFLNEEEEATERRHAPKFEQLRFGLESGPGINAPLPPKQAARNNEDSATASDSLNTGGARVRAASASLAEVLHEEKEELKIEYDRFLQYAQASVCASGVVSRGVMSSRMLCGCALCRMYDTRNVHTNLPSLLPHRRCRYTIGPPNFRQANQGRLFEMSCAPCPDTHSSALSRPRLVGTASWVHQGRGRTRRKCKDA